MKLKDWDEKEQRRDDEGERLDTDLEAEEWEQISAEMDEESLRNDSMQGEDSETGGSDRRMRGQDLEEDQRWEESELDFKPGVSYRWKKFKLMTATGGEENGQKRIRTSVRKGAGQRNGRIPRACIQDTVGKKLPATAEKELLSPKGKKLPKLTAGDRGRGGKRMWRKKAGRRNCLP